MTRLEVLSGSRKLAACSLSAGKDAPTVLICHGIGERVEYWGATQAMLREMGLSSIVFDYSGYGDSTGSVSAGNCEADAIAVYRYIRAMTSQSIFLLGYSLGSGVAAAIAAQLELDGLILCETFSTLREGVAAIGFRGWMTCLVPDVWRTIDRLEELDHIAELDLRTLVVHGDQDRLFPVAMAAQVAEACGSRGELRVIHGVGHNAPIYAPTMEYWGSVAEWVKALVSTDRLE